jgi:hypothetical protein
MFTAVMLGTMSDSSCTTALVMTAPVSDACDAKSMLLLNVQSSVIKYFRYDGNSRFG